MHNYKIDDRVYYPVDVAPFVVVGIRKETVEIYGDWSGGTNYHNAYANAWVHYSELELYDDTKVVKYIDGKPHKNGIAI